MHIRKIASLGASLALVACAPPTLVRQSKASSLHSSHPPTACLPANGRQGQPGCWIIATALIGAPTAAQYWHVYEFAAVQQAQPHAHGPARIITAFGRTFLVAVTSREWRVRGGRHLATVGPLNLLSTAPHTASFMEATFTPGMLSRIHTHPGPEAWVVLEGEQCLETSEGVIRARVGDAMMVRGGIPMALFGPRRGVRRALVLILHPASEPPGTTHDRWKPSGACSGQRSAG